MISRKTMKLMITTNKSNKKEINQRISTKTFSLININKSLTKGIELPLKINNNNISCQILT